MLLVSAFGGLQNGGNMTNKEKLSKDILEHDAEWVYNKIKVILDMSLGYNNSRGAIISWLNHENETKPKFSWLDRI